jgi:molybdenum cofactor cytidylyltransferase
MNLSYALRVNSGNIIALVGGGGKTTAMFRLADELSPRLRVLTTTSTRIFAAQIKRSPAHVTFSPTQESLADLLPQLDAAIARYGQVLLIGQADPVSGKAFGLPPQLVDKLAATGHFDVILNEADGARMRPFKAPAEHEPVIPASTTLVVPVVGLDILGQPLTDDTVHRAQLVSRLSGAAIGRPVTIDTVAAVLGHPQGGLKNIPTLARVTPVLNKLDRSNLPAAAELATRLLAYEQIDSVAIGAVQAADSPVTQLYSRAAAVILAAGGATRFGSPKQLAQWGQKTLLEHTVETALASAARPVIVVLGAEVTQSQKILAHRPVQTVINPAWAEGQSTSMRAGLAALPGHIGCALFLLADMPGVSTELINRLIQRHQETLAPLVWPEFAGRRGNPVLFDRALFPELRQVTGDTGGKPVLLRHQDRAERVIVADETVLRDIDRLEDMP